MALISRATKRKLRRFIGWDKAKGAGVMLLARLLRRRGVLPDRFYEAGIELASALLLAFYWFPWNPWRRACRDVCRLAGDGKTGREVYAGLVARLGTVARIFLVLWKEGAEAAARRMGFEPGSEETIRATFEKHRGGFLLLPHCLGGVLSAAYFSRVVPTVILSKGPPSERRAEIQRSFIELLEVELLVLDGMAKSTVARSILRAIRSGRFIVATTDLLKKTDESLEASFFSRPVHLPSWPARFSRKTGRPIVPGYVFVRGDRIEIRAGEPFVEDDMDAATQRWSEAFQKYILEEPSDWGFLFDLRWARVLREAVKGLNVEGETKREPRDS
jgi:lauroyl/myristoyl acyltransferase